MIELMKRENMQITWIIFHVMMGIIVTYFPLFLILWIYILFINSGFDLLSKGNTDGVVHNLLAYYLGMEILTRITKASPIIPYESGKYLMFVLLAIGIAFSGRTKTANKVGWIIIILIIPSAFVLPATFTYKDIIFNDSGIINLSLCLVYFSRTPLSPTQLKTTLRFIIYGIIPVLVSVIAQTPDFDDLKFTLAANFDTSAGFGSNQVSTILSLGFLIVGFCYLTNVKIFRYSWITFILLGSFFFRGLLTFSRGGIVGALIVLLLVLIARGYWPVQKVTRVSNLVKILSGVLLVIGVFYYANNLTSNILLQRYQGETKTTLSGLRERDLSLITSNRIDILYSDLRIWYDHILFGVGPGMAKYNRVDLNTNEVAAHVETSRLLAEHGLFGLVICLILFFYPIHRISRQNVNFLKLLSICLFGYALFTSFHSAMRTNVTPFLYGLAAVPIYFSIRAKKK